MIFWPRKFMQNVLELALLYFLLDFVNILNFRFISSKMLTNIVDIITLNGHT